MPHLLELRPLGSISGVLLSPQRLNLNKHNSLESSKNNFTATKSLWAGQLCFFSGLSVCS